MALAKGENMKQCENCKQTIDEKAKVCPYCGKKQIDINKITKNVKKTLYVSIVLEIVTIILLMIAIGVNAIRIKNKPSKANIMSAEAMEHNSIFESYCGTDVTPTEVRNLLSEIRTNNRKAINNQEPNTIGVCFILKNATTNKDFGIYSMDVSEINSEMFAELNFSSNVDEMIEELKRGKRYIVNIPNSKVWQDDSKGITGFEKDNIQTGSTGGYYTSGFIRLIYIIENDQ